MKEGKLPQRIRLARCRFEPKLLVLERFAVQPRVVAIHGKQMNGPPAHVVVTLVRTVITISRPQTRAAVWIRDEVVHITGNNPAALAGLAKTA